MRAIPYVALLIGVLVAGLGIFGLVEPGDFGAALNEFQKRVTIYGIAAIRVAIGVVLMLAAGTSRAPFLLGALGLIVVLGGLVTPFMAAPLRASVERFLSDGSVAAIRVWCGVAVVMGAFIFWATKPRRK